MLMSDQHSFRYKVRGRPVGLAVIIGNDTFDRMPRRETNAVDMANMKALFKFLGFKVEKHENKTCTEMLNIIRHVATKEDHTRFDYFALVIMTHGHHQQQQQGCLYGTDASIPIRELLLPLKANRCKSLVGKPKLIFIEASHPSEKCCSYFKTDADEWLDENVTLVPVEADYLYCFSSVVVPASSRNICGSCYIQALKEVFENFCHQYDILTLLTFVNKDLSDFQSSKPESGHHKQICSIESTLTKLLFFNQSV
ncbi:hypothetical protein HELRODRAFT_111841 [Helobdella robusta]|uniref:Caspase family p20 domain-containing protein n=1 Tax=Helobdella robusta TaxID=6412 RepID=T1EFE9_HELRO|nr:hypothetical protein HELRODRAFT_111841 [Helobdella robusta]ESO03853.1 hypothetical protein HELRODRAFT_111841 [Helobdella robusta]